MTCSFEFCFSDSDIILVTGASSGIGAKIALKLNELGATVIAAGRNKNKLENIKNICKNPAIFHAEINDLAENMDTLENWADELREKYGKFSGLAFSAGITLTSPFMAYNYKEAQKIFDLLCHAPLLLAKSVCRHKNCLDKGISIVFIAAAASVCPNMGQTVYGAAKAALACAARCMAKELAKRKTRVNCISPGLVKTAMLEETANILGSQFIESELEKYPLGIGLPEDAANLAAFLLSPASRWITGQNIIIDGGRLL